MRIVLSVVTLLAAAVASAQTTPAPAPSGVEGFEVASIKPNREISNRSNLNLQPGGRFVGTNVSLMGLISVAYGEGGFPLPGNRLVVKENWIGGTLGGGFTTADRFDIVAKADREITQEEVATALRKLLADRFKLVVHHETKELPVYHLMLARGDGRLGPKLRRSDVDCSNPSAAGKNDDGTSKCGFRRLPGRATGRATMAQIAAPMLNNAVDDHRPVEDHTGLSGTFEFDLEWTPTLPVPADAPPAPPVDPQGPPLFTALREQLGLKLEPEKQRIDVLVVDHAEHPTEN